MGQKRRKQQSARRSWWIWFRIIIAVIVIGGGLVTYRVIDFGSLSSRGSNSPQVHLVRVVDGDTVVFRQGGEELKVRLAGIDAPELGNSASFRAALECAELLEQAADIELEPEPSKPHDKYGRMLAWVWLSMPDTEGRVLLQEELIARGVVELYRDATGYKYFARLAHTREAIR
jgi:micrococcal nuclease